VKKVFYFIITTLLLAAGCNINDLDFNNLEGPTITSNSGIPIGHVSYTMRELIEEISDPNLLLTEDETSLISFTYFDTVNYAAGTDLIDISSIVIPSSSVVIPAIIASPIDPDPITFSETLEFSYTPTNQERIDSILYDEGSLTFNLTITPDQGFITSYTATIIDTKNVTTKLPMTFTTGANPQSADLSNHKTNFNILQDKNGVDSVNVFRLVFEYVVDLPADTPLEETTIDVSIGYSADTDYEIVYGRFGQDTVAFQGDVLSLNFFDELGESGFRLGNPKLKFTFLSNLGVPMGIQYDGIYGVEGTSPNTDTTYLKGDITEVPQLLNIANVPGDFEVTKDSITNSNSTIVSFLATTPNQIGFDLSAITNPFDTEQSNFLVPNTEITAFVEAVLPLEIQLIDVTRDIDFSLGGGLDFSEADSLTLRIISINEMPFSVMLDLEIYDENDSLIFIVPDNTAIETPFLNFDGSLKQPRKHVEDIPINEEGIKALNNGSRLNMRVTFNTPKSLTSNDIFVEILADYKLDIQISAVGTLKVNL
jgi:hypothetical protein